MFYTQISIVMFLLKIFYGPLNHTRYDIERALQNDSFVFLLQLFPLLMEVTGKFNLFAFCNWNKATTPFLHKLTPVTFNYYFSALKFGAAKFLLTTIFFFIGNEMPLWLSILQEPKGESNWIRNVNKILRFW